MSETVEEALAARPAAEGLTAALRGAVETLEKQLARAGREQFKPNALLAQVQQTGLSVGAR